MEEQIAPIKRQHSLITFTHQFCQNRHKLNWGKEIYECLVLEILDFCQAQPQLNSTELQLKLRLRLALIPLSPATRPPTHPVTRKSRLSQTFQSLLDQLES